MNLRAQDLFTPCILVVDDEKQIHSSLRLRLGETYQLVCLSSPQEALTLISRQPFDLCIVDVHMPGMDGLTFIEAARGLDAALGYVILSGFDSEENLRRAIPLGVYEFLAKPLPDRAGFEQRIPEWIEQTRQRRRELDLAKESATVAQDLQHARIEKDVESTASAAARETLLQATCRLTTVQALLLNARHTLDSLERKEPKLQAAQRSLVEAQRSTEEVASVIDAFFTSAYADPETSPAVIDTCLRHGVDIAMRRTHAEERRLSVDLSPVGRELTVANLAGIDFLLMFVPALIQSLEVAAPDTTVQVRCEELPRLGALPNESRWREYLWINRRHATSSSPGVVIGIRASAPAPTEGDAGDWLRDRPTPMRTPSRGILQGIHKAKGLLGMATEPASKKFELLLALPV